jgi:protein-disulfide isomerase
MKLCFALLVPCFLACATAAQGAEPSKESERDQQQIVALTKEVQSQQTAIAENQTKINEKLAAVAEAIRQAKIYAGRGR